MTLEKVYDELISMIEDLRSGQRLADNAIADLQKETKGALDRSGNPITINDAAPINAESLVVEFEPIQEGSGDPSPTNIRPITGYTECDVDDVGKNKADIYSIPNVGGQGDNRIVQNNDGTIRVYSVSAISVSTGKTLKSLTNLEVGKSYVFSFVTTSTQYNLIYLNGSNFIWNNGTSRTITQADLDSEVWFYADGRNTDSLISDFMIRLSTETDPTFAPYHSSNATIQFGQTVYGGTVDFKTGVATITDANIASYAGETLPSTWISDRDEYSSGGTPTTGAQVCYKLATQQTIQLTPAELKLLKGTNNITTNGTTINLGYQPDNVLGQILAVSEADDQVTLNAAKAYADSVVTITPALESGTKLADYTISGTAGIIYGPSEQQATRKATVKKSTKEE